MTEVKCYIFDCYYHDGINCTYEDGIIIDESGCNTYYDEN